MQDNALLEQWQRQRNAEAFHTLTRRYATMVYATALRVLRNPTDAEDVTQRCFEKLATQPRVPGNAIGPWLHRVAVNAALDTRRGEERRANREAAYQEAQPKHTEITWDDIYPMVDEAIANLPEKMRRAVVAHYIEQHTHADIAQSEGVSREAITQRIRRGVDLVRDNLRKRGVTVPATVLGGLLATELAKADSIPAPLAARLGQIAVSGFTLPVAGILAGLMTPAKLAAMAATLLAVAGAVWLFTTATPDSPTEQANVPTDTTASSAVAIRTDPAPLAEPSATTQISNATSPPPPAGDPALTVRVLDAATGRGISGAVVSVISEETRERIETDATGSGSLPALAPGDYYVGCFSANGYYLGHELRGDQREVRQFSVLENSPPRTEEFSLSRGEMLSGRVIDDAGAPVADALVTVGAEVQNHHLMNTSRSDDEGRFTVSGFPPTMEAWVWAESEGHASVSTGPVSLPADPAQSLEVVLQPAASVRGHAVYSTGKPVAHVEISPQYTPHVSVRRWSAETDGQGHFEIAGLPTGNLILKVWDGNSILNDHKNFSLAPGEHIEDMELFCPLGSGEIAGRVVDQHGKGLSRARVECYPLDGGTQSSIRTESDGSFTLSGLEPGRYMLEADRFGEYLRTKVQEVRTGDTSVRIVLGALPNAEGQVVDAATNRPVTRFSIKSPLGPELATHPQSYENVEDEEGRFSVRLSHLGENLIVVRAEGYAFGQVTVSPSQPGELIRGVKIALQPQADYRGAVQNESGEGIANAAILSGSPSPSLANDMIACRTVADGSFVLPASLLGHPFISVVHPDYAEAKVDITDAHRAGDPILVTLGTGATVECEVFVDGVASASATVYLHCESCGNVPFEKPRKQGDRSIFQGLAPGRYVLQAHLESSGAQKTERFELKQNDHLEMRLDLKTGTAQVDCVLTNGSALPAMVTLFTGGEDVQAYYVHEIQEEISFTKLTPGRAELQVSYQLPENGGNIRQRYDLVLEAGMTTVQEVTFAWPGQVSGTLSSPTQSENTRLLVFFGEVPPQNINTGNYDFEREYCANLPIEADGTFNITSLTPGTYTLAAVGTQNGQPILPGYAVVDFSGEDINVTLEPAP